MEISKDGTIKIDYDGYASVIIPNRNEKYSLCISCQIGCFVGCVFCRAGQFRRNLNQSEMILQFADANRIMKRVPNSIVFMGTGEPLLNFDEVLSTINLLNSHYGISFKRITVSTSGFNLNKLIDQKFMVALSLHTMDEQLRKFLMPNAPSVKDVVEWIWQYATVSKNDPMIEIALIEGINDRHTDLKQLIEYNWPSNVNFNLIEFNDYKDFKRSSRIRFFKEELRTAGYKCFIRESRGADIAASCGMISCNLDSD